MAGQKSAIEPNAVYSREEAAQLLGVSLSTLKRMIADGYLRASKLNGGRRIFIRGSHILDMLDKSTLRNNKK